MQKNKMSRKMEAGIRIGGRGGGKKHGSLARVALNIPNRISSLNNFLELPAMIAQTSGSLSL